MRQYGGSAASGPAIASTRIGTKRFVLRLEGVKNFGLVAKQVTSGGVVTGKSINRSNRYECTQKLVGALFKQKGPDALLTMKSVFI